MIRLNSPEIHYLDFDILQDFSTVNVKTKEGDVIKLNLLTLAAFDSNLSKSLLSMKDDKEEDIVIITEYSWLDLISLQHFCMKGLFPLPPEEVQNDPNICQVFNSFGIDLKTLAQQNLKKEIKEEPLINTRSQKRKKLIVPKLIKKQPKDSDSDDDWVPDTVMESGMDWVEDQPKEESESEVDDDEDKDATWSEPVQEEIELDVKPKRRIEPIRRARRDNMTNYLKYKAELSSVVRLPEPQFNDVDKTKLDTYVLQEPPDNYIKPPEPLRYLEIDDLHKPIKCSVPECPRRFNNDKGLKIHFLRFHQTHYACPYCRQDFSLDDFESFRKHMFRHEHVTKVTEPAECIQCGYSSIRMESVKKHVKSGGPYHTNQCTQCEVRFSSWDEHKAHVAFHHDNIWKLKCGLCEELFESKQKVQSHRQKVHHKLPAIFPVNKGQCKDPSQKFCDICGKIVQSLTYHKKNYHVDQNLTCQHCGKSFKNPISLSHHIGNVHEKIACSICGEMVSKKREWRHMQQKHTANENKKFKCKYCGKGFISSANLRDHIHTHTGEKPYVCKFCGAAFASVGNHRMHERGHLGHKRSK